MISLGLSLVIICALFTAPFFHHAQLLETVEIAEDRQLNQLSNILPTDLSRFPIQVLIQVIEVGSTFWDFIVEIVGGAGNAQVIRDFVRVTLDRSPFYRLCDGLSGLVGFSSLIAKNLAEMAQSLSSARGDPDGLLSFLNQIFNVTSQTTSVGVGLIGTALDTYTVVRNLICLPLGYCGRYDFLDMVGSFIVLVATVVAHVLPSIGPYIPVFQTYYTVITWSLQTVDEAAQNVANSAIATIAAAAAAGKTGSTAKLIE